MSEISLKLNGKYFRDWSNILVTKELETVAGSFEFDLIATESEWFPVLEGDFIEIFHKKTPLITGYIDFTCVTGILMRCNYCGIMDPNFAQIGAPYFSALIVEMR